jgi:hypothetical protein
VRDTSQITVTAVSSACADVLCSSCDATLRFFAGEQAVFVGELQVGRQPVTLPPPASAPVPAAIFPRFMRPLIATRVAPPEMAEESSDEFDDPIYDDMFSMTVKPTMGSYRSASEYSWGSDWGSPESDELGQGKLSPSNRCE